MPKVQIIAIVLAVVFGLLWWMRKSSNKGRNR